MPSINRRKILASPLGFACAAAVRAVAPRPPNIVLILADDLGYGDVGCFGQNAIQTPAIDRLANEGARYTQFYAGSCVCAPSRCSLLTGRHTGTTRIRGNHSIEGERVSLRPDDVTVAEVLRSAGYATGAFGKWGVGEAGTRGVPTAQGFDEWFGFLNQDHALDYYPTHLWSNEREYFPPRNQGVKREQYAQDLIMARALNFVEEQRDKPFFLYLAPTLPHASSEVGRDTGDGFVVPSYGRYEDKDWPRPEKGYAAMVELLDRDVDRLTELIDRLGLAEETLILFTSDNGPAVDGGHHPNFFGSRGGLRGRKSTLYEGGVRVPTVARWPGRIRPNTNSEAVIAAWDLLPTFAALAAVSSPPMVNGMDRSAVLLGQATPQRADDLYWEWPLRRNFQQALRRANWKIVRQDGPQGEAELFDLATDPGEQCDLSSDRPRLVQTLSAAMDAAHTPSPRYYSPYRQEAPHDKR